MTSMMASIVKKLLVLLVLVPMWQIFKRHDEVRDINPKNGPSSWFASARVEEEAGKLFKKDVRFVVPRIIKKIVDCIIHPRLVEF